MHCKQTNKSNKTRLHACEILKLYANLIIFPGGERARSGLRNTHTFTPPRAGWILFGIIMPLRAHKNWCKKERVWNISPSPGKSRHEKLDFPVQPQNYQRRRAPNGCNLLDCSPPSAKQMAEVFHPSNFACSPPKQVVIWKYCRRPRALSEKAREQYWRGCCASNFIARRKTLKLLHSLCLFQTRNLIIRKYLCVCRIELHKDQYFFQVKKMAKYIQLWNTSWHLK